MNRLAGERSAYLKHASDQKIHWYPWSEEAFQQAKKDDKPVFLSSGAVWCHWCHVMAAECFHDREIADALNEHFISIKLDRDERPDIDKRYQLAVSAMGAGAGWPLSVFLTPDKIPFYGGTYFPPEDRMGRPGFKKVIKAVHELYQSGQDQIQEYTDKLMHSIQQEAHEAAAVEQSQVDSAVKTMMESVDQSHGGFGSAPKFPMSGALDFLIGRYALTGEAALGDSVRLTLDAMAYGGFYDQLGGGFHRYSTDEEWVIPHFEKMADDNAWLLKNYCAAYASLGDPLYRDTAKGIAHYVMTVLSDPSGGFYASQDADVTPDDEGGYFTWTEKEFKDILTEDEFAVLSGFLLHDQGSMHHDPAKKVLFAAGSADALARRLGRSTADVAGLISSGKEKLLRHRDRRQTPFIDTALYASVNGMFISAFLLASRVLGDPSLKEFALKSLDTILEKFFRTDALMHTDSVRGLLDDYAHMIDALTAAYEVTGDSSYAERADHFMEICIRSMWDNKEGGFFDGDEHFLDLRLKAIEDIPHPSGNALCIAMLLKLSAITGKESFRVLAEQALKVFSTKAGEIGIHAGYYFSVLDQYFNAMKITLYSRPGSPLHKAALSSYRPGIVIVFGEDRGYAVPCCGDVCSEPLKKPDALREFIVKKMHNV